MKRVARCTSRPRVMIVSEPITRQHRSHRARQQPSNANPGLPCRATREFSLERPDEALYVEVDPSEVPPKYYADPGGLRVHEAGLRLTAQVGPFARSLLPSV